VDVRNGGRLQRPAFMPAASLSRTQEQLYAMPPHAPVSAGVAEPPAHESPPAPRVCRACRPGSSNITASCVAAGVGAVMLAADPACAPGRAARAPACLQPSRPPLGAGARPPSARKKSARASNLAQWSVATATEKKSWHESSVAGRMMARSRLESRRMVAGGSSIRCRVRYSRDFLFCFEDGVA